MKNLFKVMVVGTMALASFTSHIAARDLTEAETLELGTALNTLESKGFTVESLESHKIPAGINKAIIADLADEEAVCDRMDNILDEAPASEDNLAKARFLRELSAHIAFVQKKVSSSNHF